MAPSSSSFTVEKLMPQHQVFISFRGEDTRYGFTSHLVEALENHQINVFIDEKEDKGSHLETLLKRIGESKIAVLIISENYTNSIWCIRELAKIKECGDKGKGEFVAIPIFYKVDPSTVANLTGEFGEAFRSEVKGYEKEKRKEWKEAFNAIPDFIGYTIEKKSLESEIVKKIVEQIKKYLSKDQGEGSQNSCVNPSEDGIAGISSVGENRKTFGNEKRLKELEEKFEKYKGTRIIRVVGMPGIGKTTLLKEFYKNWHVKFTRHALIDQIREKSKQFEELDSLPQVLFNELSKLNKFHKPSKDQYSELRERKHLVILDDVSNREQLDAFLRVLDSIKKGKEGSMVIIATSDMSLTNDLVDDTYTVQSLNHNDSLQLFKYHALGDGQASPPDADLKKLSDEFVHYTRGHPLALEIIGKELNYKQDRKHWISKLEILAQSPSPSIRSVFKVSYDDLTSDQKVAFRDIACFRTEDVDYVRSLLALSDPVAAIKALEDKFLINTCDGRVDMHDLLYTFARELEPKASTQDPTKQRRLWLHQNLMKQDVFNELQKTMRAADIRGLFLDLSEVKDETSLESDHFTYMDNLRYLKFYNSHCPLECKTVNKINIPDGLNLPLKEVRCLHWLKFPSEELPKDFNPANLVDLKLPYSEIERLWDDGVKDTQALKWVDLNHSSKLSNLSGLSEAINLQRLNVEGCTSLESLGDVNSTSLKTLILSNCSKFKEFPSIPEKLEDLYLDGTAISQLPDNIVNLQRLVLLNMKGCKMLETIPTYVGELKALQKLVLAGCLKLKKFPDMNKSSLTILLLDGTSINTMPQLPSVQYLCLSRNDQIKFLPAGINQLSQLTSLELKYCTSLTFIPELPPNLQYFDAHGCSSLKTVGKPLARIMPTVQKHCTFNFTNCDNLEQAAKEEITSYAQRKCQLLSDARKHYSGGLGSEALFSICFPGCEVPSWFSYEAVGSLLQRKLLPHWHDKRLSGIALCAVVSFPGPQDLISCFSVTCTFTIKVEGKSWIPFTCQVGSWNREGDEKDKIESNHVVIAYISCPHTIRCLDDENSDKCNFTEASLEFTVTGGTSKVGRCGLSLMYA